MTKKKNNNNNNNNRKRPRPFNTPRLYQYNNNVTNNNSSSSGSEHDDDYDDNDVNLRQLQQDEKDDNNNNNIEHGRGGTNHKSSNRCSLSATTLIQSESSSLSVVPPSFSSTVTMLHNSRKKARKVTTLFHRYTIALENELQKEIPYRNSNTIELLEKQIEQIGGRSTYQKASQISTRHNSTSKWVLSYLHQNGWLYGIRDISCSSSSSSKTTPTTTATATVPTMTRLRQIQRRTTRILEIGAINTELLDAADAVVVPIHCPPHQQNQHQEENQPHSSSSPIQLPTKNISKKRYNISVRAIDLHSMHPNRIEEMDFLQLPSPSTTTTTPLDSDATTTDNNTLLLYDVIVCSMVLNCVPTPEQRGRMLQKLYEHCSTFQMISTTPNSTQQHDASNKNDDDDNNNTIVNTHPTSSTVTTVGGFVFLTIPKTCLTYSDSINVQSFEKMLTNQIGFDIIAHTKQSPKICYYILQKKIPPSSFVSPFSLSPVQSHATLNDINSKKTKKRKNMNKKKSGYRTNFAITLPTTYDKK